MLNGFNGFYFTNRGFHLISIMEVVVEENGL